jgi:hypothetical protein
MLRDQTELIDYEAVSITYYVIVKLRNTQQICTLSQVTCSRHVLHLCSMLIQTSTGEAFGKETSVSSTALLVKSKFCCRAQLLNDF